MNDRTVNVVIFLAIIVGALFLAIELRPKPAPNADPAKPAPAKRQLIYVTAPRCPACVMMEKQTFDNAKVRERLESFTFSKVLGKDAVQRYEVKAFPTYLILGADGKEVKRGTGFLPPNEFLAWLD